MLGGCPATPCCCSYCWCHRSPHRHLHYGSCRSNLNKGSFPPSSSSIFSTRPNLLPLPTSSFLPILLLPGFYMNLLVLVFILIRVTVDMLAHATDLLMFFIGVNLCGLCLLIFAVILVCFKSSPIAFSIEAALRFFSLQALVPKVLPSSTDHMVHYFPVKVVGISCAS